MDSETEVEVIITNWGGLSGRLLNLLTTGDMFDVQLQVGSYLFGAHKLILSASSDVFKTMLTNHKWSEAHKQTIELVEEPGCESVFSKFIHYIYTGQLYLTHRTACPMLTLADKYNVKELIPLCRNYMLDHLEAPVHLSSVLQWWRVAHLRNDVETERKILRFIELNFNKVIQSPDFLYASIDTVEALIASSKLVVYNELMIFYGVLRWIQNYINSNGSHFPVSSKQIQSIFGQFLKHIRWSLMTEEEIKLLKQNQNVLQILRELSYEFSSSHPFVVCNSSDRSVASHLDATVSNSCDVPAYNLVDSVVTKNLNDLSLERHDQASDRLLSRVYISEYWATELCVQNFALFPKYKVQTFFFSSPKMNSCSEDDGQSLEWEVELHPKGVHFPPAIMIGVDSDGNKMIDELFVDTVRLSVMSRSPQELPLKVEVNVLVRANSPSEVGGTYFERGHSRTCFFEHESQRHNFDDIVPLNNLDTFLLPCPDSMPEMYLTPTVSFSLCVVIRPLPP